jgi:beta-N-acetylhexosaminidase
MPQMMLSFNGNTVPDHMLDMVTRGEVVSFCIFKKNVKTPAELRAIAEQIHAAAKRGGQPTPLVGVDQEGGQLMVVANGATELPGNMALGATGSAELAEEAGRITARELRAMGITMNFAPTLDVNINPFNPVIGIRSFGDNPRLVADLGVAMIKGIQSEGVIATVKHFPGHGDTDSDSHLAVPIVHHDRARLHEVEIMPFKAAIQAGVGAIMTAHVIYTALDADNPATLSKPILTGLLRGELGYQGLIVTDAMDMYAVARLGAHASTSAALQAGADLIMLGHVEGQADLHATFKNQYHPQSLTRIRQAQARLSSDIPDFSLVGHQDHWAVAQKIADKSITIVRQAHGALPIASEKSVGIITVQPTNLTPADSSAFIKIKFADAIQKRRPDATAHTLPYQANDAALRDALGAMDGYDVVVVGTLNASQDDRQAELVRALIARGQAVIVVALRTPYDLIAFPQVETYLCAYGIRDVTTEAVARVLFGEIIATGVLPCAIPGIQVAP